MQSSSKYTFRPVKQKKTGRIATFVLIAGAIWGGVTFGIGQNGGWEAVFNSGGATNGLTGLTGSPTPTKTTKPSGSGAASATGDPVDYPFGTIQLSVTRSNGKITKVGLVQAYASAGRDQAFPVLQQAAITNNGSSFGNLSGATYTTDTFKQALDSAISKLP